MALQAAAGPSIRDHYERDVLSKYGRGLELADIAGAEAHREKVGEVISRVCQYNRQRARAAVLAYDAAMASPAVRRQREQTAAPPTAPRPPLLPCRCGCGKMTSTGLARGHNVRLNPNLTPKPKATDPASGAAMIAATVVEADSAAAAEEVADLTAEEVADLSAPITADDIPDLPPIEPPDAPAAAPEPAAATEITADVSADPPCGEDPEATPPMDEPTATEPSPAPVSEPVAAQPRRVRPAPPVFADPADEELVMPPDIEAALKDAEASGVPNIHRRAIHIRRLLSELHQQLDASAKERAIRKTIAVLEQQRLQALEELRALRAGVVSKAGLEGLSRGERDKIREWAVEKKMPINANGKIPKDILSAYQAAMQEVGDV